MSASSSCSARLPCERNKMGRLSEQDELCDILPRFKREGKRVPSTGRIPCCFPKNRVVLNRLHNNSIDSELVPLPTKFRPCIKTKQLSSGRNKHYVLGWIKRAKIASKLARDE